MAIDFPEKLVNTITSKELDYILMCLGNEKLVSRVVNSFYIACEQNIWKEVSSQQLSNTFDKIRSKLLYEKNNKASLSKV